MFGSLAIDYSLQLPTSLSFFILLQSCPSVYSKVLGCMAYLINLIIKAQLVDLGFWRFRFYTDKWLNMTKHFPSKKKWWQKMIFFSLPGRSSLNSLGRMDLDLRPNFRIDLSINILLLNYKLHHLIFKNI